MKILKEKSINEAANLVLNLIPCNKNINICLTGGNFGKLFIRTLIKENKDINSWEIFYSDERLGCPEEDENKTSILEELSQLKGFSDHRINCFNNEELIEDTFLDIKKKFKVNNIDKFDICLLSLGEDGHLAGHFSNSLQTMDPRFCYTNNAIKPPKHRISFNMNWLMSSKKVLLAVFGSEKEKALKDLSLGKGLHSNIWGSKNLVVLTDIELED